MQKSFEFVAALTINCHLSLIFASSLLEMEDPNAPVSTVEVNDNEKTQPEPIFVDLTSDEAPAQIESLCMNCHEMGTTNLLLTKIPFFREIILMSFRCKHCGWRNNEIQFGGSIAENGCVHKLKITESSDLNRQVVKSDNATICIPELDFEIPPITQKGTLNTIEGFLAQTIEGLRAAQPERYLENPDVARKVESFIEKLEQCKDGEMKFTFIIDDPSGNSFIENIHAPNPDPHLMVTHYERSREQNQALGISDALQESEQEEKQEEQIKKKATGSLLSGEDAEALVRKEGPGEIEEVMRFPTTCSVCGKRGETRMCTTSKPPPPPSILTHTYFYVFRAMLLFRTAF